MNKLTKETVTETKSTQLALVLEESKEESSVDESRRYIRNGKMNRKNLILRNELSNA